VAIPRLVYPTCRLACRTWSKLLADMHGRFSPPLSSPRSPRHTRTINGRDVRAPSSSLKNVKTQGAMEQRTGGRAGEPSRAPGRGHSVHGLRTPTVRTRPNGLFIVLAAIGCRKTRIAGYRLFELHFGRRQGTTDLPQTRCPYCVCAIYGIKTTLDRSIRSDPLSS
jgi:hypothetical protein